MNLQRVVLASVLLAGAGVAIVTACTNLDDIAQNQCGNAIVEVEAGEQCDTWDFQDAFACFGGDAGTKACHVACNDAGACPQGWGCGVDGVCRSPSHTYAGTPLVTTDVRDLLLADFDGDGRLDLLTRGLGTTAVYFFDGTGAPNGVAGPLTLTRGRVAAGALAPGANASVIAFDTSVSADGIVAGTGINVWNGQTGRTLSPILFASAPVNAIDSRVIPAQVLGSGGPHPGNDDIVVLAQGQWSANVGGLLGYFDNAALAPEYSLPIALNADLRGDVPVARIPASAPCDSVVLGFKSANNAFVLRTCDDAGAPLDAGALALPNVLFQSTFAGPVFLVDWDKDGIPDIVAGTSTGLIEVALGKSDGTFAAGGAPIDVGLIEPPLAIGDIDADGTFDYVTATGGIFLSSTKQHVLPTLTLTYARIADLNNDGFPDVVGISTAGVDFWSGTGGALVNHRLYDISNTTALTIGDYDGDKNLDLIVSSGSTSPNLWVLWGTYAGYPTPQTLIGSGVAVQHITSGKLTWFFGDPPDAVWSAVAVAKEGGDGGLSIVPLQGHTSRQMTSPFILSLSSGGASPFTSPRLPMVGALGSLAAFDASTSMSVLAAPPNMDGGPLTLEPWTVPATNDLQVFHAANVVAPASGGLTMTATSATAAQGVAITLVDLDRSAANGDEMVAVVPASSADGTTSSNDGTFTISRFDGTKWTATTTETGFSGMTRVFVKDEIVLPIRLRHVDFDGDGNDDLLMVYADTLGTTPSITAEVRFGNGSGGFGATAKIPNITSAAAINALGLPGRQIISAGPTGFVLYQVVACADSTMHCFDAGTNVRVGSYGETIDLVAGDLTGDGIDDVVYANHVGFEVFVGSAVLP